MRRSRLISGLACCVLAASVFVLDAAAQNQTRLDGRLVQGGTGLPVSGASVSIVGMSGSARTDSDGRFTWVPAPPVPFQVIVIVPSGQMASPVIVDAVQGGTALIQVRPLATDAVTVLGAAPSIAATPGSATAVPIRDAPAGGPRAAPLTNASSSRKPSCG